MKPLTYPYRTDHKYMKALRSDWKKYENYYGNFYYGNPPMLEGRNNRWAKTWNLRWINLLIKREMSKQRDN